MNNNYKFFENQNCKYFKCHKRLKELNCLLCFCPLFHIDSQYCKYKRYKYFIAGKDCENCIFPHKRKNYNKIIKLLKND